MSESITPNYYIEELTRGTARWRMPAGAYKEGSPAGLLRRRKYEKRLGSGALRTLIIDRLTTEDDKPETLSSGIAVRIEADRPFKFRGTKLKEQFTELTMDIDKSNALGLGANASIPFDSQMEAETKEEWERWGILLDYKNNKKEGYLAIAIKPWQTIIMNQNLADIVNATAFSRNIEHMSRWQQFGMRLLQAMGDNYPQFGHDNPYLPY